MKKSIELLKCTCRNRIRQVLISTSIFIIFITLGYIINGFKSTNIKLLINGITCIISFALIMALIYGYFTQYKDYRIAMQLGFSRKTLWWSKFIELTILTALITIIGIINLHVGYRGILILTSMIVCVNFSITITFFALSSFLVLFSRWLGKTVMMTILSFIIYFITYETINITYQYPKLVHFIQKVLSLNMYFSFYAVCIIWITLMLIISYRFMNLIQIRRN